MGEIGSNIIIVIIRYFISRVLFTTFTSMDRLSRQNISEETLALGPIRADGLIAVCRTFYLKAAEYTLFSSAHGTYFSTDHMLCHKTSLNKCKTIVV